MSDIATKAFDPSDTWGYEMAAHRAAIIGRQPESNDYLETICRVLNNIGSVRNLLLAGKTDEAIERTQWALSWSEPLLGMPHPMSEVSEPLPRGKVPGLDHADIQHIYPEYKIKPPPSSRTQMLLDQGKSIQDIVCMEAFLYISAMTDENAARNLGGVDNCFEHLKGSIDRWGDIKDKIDECADS